MDAPMLYIIMNVMPMSWMRTKVSEYSMFSGGVCMRRKSGSARGRPTTVMSRPTARANARAVCTASLTRFLSPAPQYWLMMMVAPVDRPTKKSMNRLSRGWVESTAPRAAEPTACPTTAAST